MLIRRHDHARSACASGFTLIELLTVIAIIGVLAGLLVPVLGRVRSSAQDATCRSNLRQLGLAVQLYGTESGYYPAAISRGVAPREGGAPNGQRWTLFLRPYMGVNSAVAGDDTNSALIVCPAAAVKGVGGQVSGYSANPGLMPDLSTSPALGAVRYNIVARPSQVILIGDAIQRDPQGSHANFWGVADMTGADNLSWGSPGQGSVPIQIGSDADGINEAQFRYRHGGRANVVFVDGHAGSFAKGEILRLNVRKNY
jgi:prepilin-type N-terminal cleavage/methylation domain-containing protein/prepilin-type processing-associated H-X9-DG protein